MSARPRHPGQDPEMLETFKKDFPRALSAALADLPPGTPIEIWWQSLPRT